MSEEDSRQKNLKEKVQNRIDRNRIEKIDITDE